MDHQNPPSGQQQPTPTSSASDAGGIPGSLTIPPPAETSLPASPPPGATERKVKPIMRFLRYSTVRLLTLFLAVVVGLYITLLVAELGGKIDEVRWANIRWSAGMAVAANPEYRDISATERAFLTEQLAQQIAANAGLDRPLMVRMAEWMPQGLTLQLGNSRYIRSLTYRPPHEQRLIRLLILERIPNTLLLLGVTNLAFFFLSLSAGLFLSRRYQSWLDRLFVLLSPLSTAPAWFYGLFLVAIFAGMLGWLPFSGMRPSPPPDSPILYGLGVLRHMVLPFTAVFFSIFFYSVYIWRTYFLIYAGEDYVDMAQAKGLPDKMVERRYILLPTLPPILTSLAVIVIEVWGGSIILERLFNWPGLGDLYFEAILRMDTGVIVGLTIVYAYFLALTIFVLDIAYAFIDPRIRLSGSSAGQAMSKATVRKQGWRRFWLFRKPTTSIWQRLAPSRSNWRRRLSWTAVSQLLHRLAAALAAVPRSIPPLVAGIGWGLRQLVRYPTALVGLSIICIMLASVVYTVRTIPLSEAIELWRASEADWHEVPRNARPTWVNYFSQQKLPETVVMDSREGAGDKMVEQVGSVKEITLTYTFDFPYDAFPQEPMVYFYPRYNQTVPHTTMTWLTPDGREIRLGQQSPRYAQRYRFSQDNRLMRRLDGLTPQQGLFVAPDAGELIPLKGEYQLQIRHGSN